MISRIVKGIFRLIKSTLFIGFIAGIFVVFIFQKSVRYTSSDKFCDFCHAHPHVTASWRLSTHYDTKSGMIVHCTECHLPPGGINYYTEKARLGIKDTWGKVFKDISKIDWEKKSRLENAVSYVYKSSCLKCHQNLFPLKLSKKGEEAHLYYTQKADKIRCINCHLFVGHYSEKAVTGEKFANVEIKEKEIYKESAKVERFENYTEFIPETSVKFEMVAVPGGTFTIGSPESEPYRKPDEGPARKVRLSSFWMGKTEVSWDEYEAFYRQTARDGKSSAKTAYLNRVSKPEAITGATPPYTAPGQGWGKGSRPAITMTHYAATVYCSWLSQVTGKKYRLPTEAEWEYACRSGTESPYFFEGSPKDYTKRRFWNRIFGADTATISSYVIYKSNSEDKTQIPANVQANPFGLLNMLGNVREFCLDWYKEDTYLQYPENEVLIDPMGPSSGTEHVIRGGSFRNDAADVRSASRDHTRHDLWLLTDPQMPKSKWWYSDCIDVGFRVVCEYKSEKK